MYNNLSWGMLVYDFDKSNKDSLLVVEDRFVWDNHLANPKKENFNFKNFWYLAKKQPVS